MCETYPTLLGVPAAVSDEGLIQASQFRSKGRLPVSYLSLLALKYIAIHAYIGKQRDIHRTTNIACVFQNIQLHAHIRYMHTYTACAHILHVHIHYMSTYTACAHILYVHIYCMCTCPHILHVHIYCMCTYTTCPHTLHVHIYCMSTYTACAHTFWL